ncbi:MAG: amidohydrolase family protein [Betaproteobacteria bacterium]|nr:amidohydrolase family protein [Betaproteobacteria bacterium]
MRMIIRDVRIWDGTGAEPFAGEVLVDGNRIVSVAPRPARLPDAGARVIEGGGATLMPGLVEGHAHLTFCGMPRSTDLGEIPPEEHTLATMHNARVLLDAGFTSAFSAASAKLRLDVVIRNEIEAGRIPGPRLRAASPEITVTGGLGDENRLHATRSSFGLIADGPDEIARTVRLCAREGVDTIKINVSGDGPIRAAKSDMTVMREAEARMACEVAHDFGCRVAAHARASSSVLRSLACGVDVVYHCELADARALDALEAARDHVFVGPAIAPIHNALHDPGPQGVPEDPARIADLERCLASAQRAYGEMRRRGIRVVIGGDYGFVTTPQGTNARDIALFVKLFGYSPSEALQCATRIGGELMELDVGLVKPGFLADLIIVDGDPLEDVRILADTSRLRLIMQDGRIHKDTLAARQA